MRYVFIRLFWLAVHSPTISAHFLSIGHKQAKLFYGIFVVQSMNGWMHHQFHTIKHLKIVFDEFQAIHRPLPRLAPTFAFAQTHGINIETTNGEKKTPNNNKQNSKTTQMTWACGRGREERRTSLRNSCEKPPPNSKIHELFNILRFRGTLLHIRWLKLCQRTVLCQIRYEWQISDGPWLICRSIRKSIDRDHDYCQVI